MADDARILSRRSLLTSAGALMAAGSFRLQSQPLPRPTGPTPSIKVESWTRTNRFPGGAFMRIGPNPLFKPDDHYAYPFDGTGMVHAVYLEDGRARYRNRWVRTREFVEERKAQRCRGRCPPIRSGTPFQVNCSASPTACVPAG